MKNLSKKLLRANWFVGFIAWLGAKYIQFVHATTKWQYIGEEYVKPYWQDDVPMVGVFWHGRLAMMCYSWKAKSDIYLMISAHRDGRLISKLISRLGFKTITGSSSRGGANALRSSISVFKDNDSVGITPDGPRGPRFQADGGAINLARLAEKDIVPASFSCTKRKIMGSWDRLIFPLPFGRGVIIYGKPLTYDEIKSKESQEWARLELENRLIEITDKADIICGHTPIAKTTKV